MSSKIIDLLAGAEDGGEKADTPTTSFMMSSGLLRRCAISQDITTPTDQIFTFLPI
jgi:hypothetical protein